MIYYLIKYKFSCFSVEIKRCFSTLKRSKSLLRNAMQIDRNWFSMWSIATLIVNWTTFWCTTIFTYRYLVYLIHIPQSCFLPLFFFLNCLFIIIYYCISIHELHISKRVLSLNIHLLYNSVAVSLSMRDFSFPFYMPQLICG